MDTIFMQFGEKLWETVVSAEAFWGGARRVVLGGISGQNGR